MINFFLISNNFKINYNYGTSFTERDSREHMEWRVPRIPTPKSEKCEWFFATLSEVCILYLIARYQIKIDDCWNCRFIATVIRKAALNISIGCRIVSVASKLAWLAFGLRSNTIWYWPSRNLQQIFIFFIKIKVRLYIYLLIRSPFFKVICYHKTQRI